MVVGSVGNASDVVADERIAAKQNLVSMADREAGEVLMSNIVPQFGRPRRVAEPLGLSEKDVSKLLEHGIVNQGTRKE